METYIIELFDGKKRVGKEKIRTDDYDDVLKRVAEIVTKTNHRIEIWDSKAYKHRNKDVCRWLLSRSHCGGAGSFLRSFCAVKSSPF